MMKLASTCPNPEMGVVWGLCLHPNTIKPCYYYSSSSRCDFIRPNSQRLMIRSLLNFTGRWISISTVALKTLNFQNSRHFKMTANIKIKNIVKNSKMKWFQWKWKFTGSKTCCPIWWHFWFPMAAILNPKWPPKYKYLPIWTKFFFQVDYDVANWYPSLLCYGGHLKSKMAAKLPKSSDWDEIWFPSRLWCCKLISIVGLLWRSFRIQNGLQNTKILRFERNMDST